MKTIQITSLDTIHEAAKEFIANMDDRTVLPFMGKWEPERQPLSRLCVKNWA